MTFVLGLLILSQVKRAVSIEPKASLQNFQKWAQVHTHIKESFANSKSDSLQLTQS